MSELDPTETTDVDDPVTDDESVTAEATDATDEGGEERVVTSVDELEVPVRFELGATTATLGLLQSIQPGYVFELPSSDPAYVTIQVNGAPIGHGELVRVGDRLGIRLVKATENASDST